MTNRGHLKVFLGYAAGVGKTYQMLEEAQQEAKRGVDVVIGYFEPHARKDTKSLDKNLGMARELNAQVEILSDEEPIDALLDFARSKGVTQIFVGHSQRRGWWHRVFGTPLERLIFEAEGMDVRVFPHP